MNTIDHALARWRQSRAAFVRRLFFDRQAEFWRGELDPLSSAAEVRARVVEIIDEADGAKTFILQPNSAWRGHRAGQYTQVEAEIDGVRVRRCYSISSVPGDPRLAITVKRVPGGRMSGWLHSAVAPGQLLRLGGASGDFAVPTPTPGKLLLLSGGSGVTPVMSMLRTLARRDDITDVVFVHYARRRPEQIFAEELDDLATRHPGLKLIVCFDDETSGRPGYDEADLARLVPDFANRSTFVCAPSGLMERVEAQWSGAGASEMLTRERFGPSVAMAQPGTQLGSLTVKLSRGSRAVQARAAATLLNELERAGMNPASGCRMGICHTCTCRKRSGTVQNLITGELSSEPDEDIRLCVSAPRSDLELDL